MHLIHEDLSRAHRHQRLREAEVERLGRGVEVADRMSRRAEEVARRARVAAARV